MIWMDPHLRGGSRFPALPDKRGAIEPSRGSGDRWGRLLVLLLVGSLLSAAEAVPELLAYQGRIAVAGAPFTGTGQFKFALIDRDGAPTYWSNDGTSSDGSEPDQAVLVAVEGGLFSVLLGDTGMANMHGVPAAVFQNGAVALRIWFSATGAVGSFERLSPDRRLAVAGYAMLAQDSNQLEGAPASSFRNAANLSSGILPRARLPIASSSALGAVRTDGSTLGIDPDGTLRVIGGGGARTILNGTSDPLATIGVDGDFYINTSTSALFGPKAGGTWPAPVSLIGPPGAAGSDGRSVLNGSGVPAVGLGADGDFYLDTSASALYGPKAGGTWPAPVSLIGPQGPAGTSIATYVASLLQGSGITLSDATPGAGTTPTIAVDSSVVRTSGVQTVHGSKTFTSPTTVASSLTISGAVNVGSVALVSGAPGTFYMDTEGHNLIFSGFVLGTIYLPVAPAKGCLVRVRHAGTAATLTIHRNGQQIDGGFSNLSLGIGATRQLIYDGIDSWWVIGN